MIDSDFRLAIEHRSRTDSDSFTSILIAPSFNYFIADDLFLGALVAIQHNFREDASQTGLGLGPTVGYNFSLGSLVSLAPRASLLYQHLLTDDSSGYELSFMLNAPILFHVRSHAFIGIGPALRRTLSLEFDGREGPKTTVLGLLSTIGIWW